MDSLRAYLTASPKLRKWRYRLRVDSRNGCTSRESGPIPFLPPPVPSFDGYGLNINLGDLKLKIPVAYYLQPTTLP